MGCQVLPMGPSEIFSCSKCEVDKSLVNNFTEFESAIKIAQCDRNLCKKQARVEYVARASSDLIESPKSG